MTELNYANLTSDALDPIPALNKEIKKLTSKFFSDLSLELTKRYRGQYLRTATENEDLLRVTEVNFYPSYYGEPDLVLLCEDATWYDIDGYPQKVVIAELLG